MLVFGLVLSGASEELEGITRFCILRLGVRENHLPIIVIKGTDISC